MKRYIISALHDTQGIYLPLITEVKDNFVKFAPITIVAVSNNTNENTKECLKNMGVQLISGELWGEARLAALVETQKLGAEQVMVIDFDKLLHWLKINKEEFEEYLNSSLNGVILGGRNENTWQSYPTSWRNTEIPTNKIFQEVTGVQADILTAQMYLNKPAVEVILKYAKDTGWGSCAEWPILLWKENIQMEAKYFEGLTFEDVDRLSMTDEEINKLYDSKEEWEKRIRNQQIITAIIQKLGSN